MEVSRYRVANEQNSSRMKVGDVRLVIVVSQEHICVNRPSLSADRRQAILFPRDPLLTGHRRRLGCLLVSHRRCRRQPVYLRFPFSFLTFACIMSGSGSSTVIFIPQTAPAGGITITQPPQTATSFYKIAPSQPITFAWNMTSVIATPTHLTVSAVCDNGNTYAVGPTDGIIPGTATEVVWDIYAYQQANPNRPLAQATYTLNIWDDRGPGAARRPGYLEQNSGLRFALYTPQAYTPLASGKSWLCSNRYFSCSYPIFSVRLDMRNLQ